MEEITRINDTGILRDKIANNEPCIFNVNDALKLEFQKTWTIDYLLEKIGDLPVLVRSTPTKKYIDPDEKFWGVVRAMLLDKMTFEKFIETGVPEGKIMSGTDTYIYCNGKVVDRWRKLWEDVKVILKKSEIVDKNQKGLSNFFETTHLNTIGLWVSGTGVKSILHYDSSGDNNLNFQIRGKKNVILFPPSDWPYLKTFLAMGLHGFDSYKELYNTDKNTNSIKFQHTNPVLAKLVEGDVLFIPSNWYHYVEHIGACNINITCWFNKSDMNKNGSSKRKVTGQSNRNFFLVLRFICASIIALILNLIWKTTGIRILKKS